MAKIFETDFRKGQWKEYINGITPSNAGTELKVAEKGMCLRCAEEADNLIYTKTLTGERYYEAFVDIQGPNSAFVGFAANGWAYLGGNSLTTFSLRKAVANYSTWSSIPSLKGIHHIVVYDPGDGQTDTADALLWIDGVAYGKGGATTTAAAENFIKVGFNNSSYDDCNSKIYYFGIHSGKPTTNWVASRNEMFLNSSYFVEQKRNFTYPKPTDLSYEVDSKIGDVDTTRPMDFDDDNWLGTATTVDNDSFSTTGANEYLYKSIFSSDDNGKKFKLVVECSSSAGGTFTVRGLVDKILYNGSNSVTLNEGVHVIDVEVLDSSYTVFEGDTASSTYTFSVKEIRPVSGLVAAYNMIPSPNGILTDISGNGHNGTINGLISTKDGMKFNGAGSNFTLSTITLADDTEWSVCMRGKFNPNTTAFRGLLTDNTYGIGVSTQGLRFRRSNDGTYYMFSQTIDPNKEYDVVYSVSGDDMSCYINGVLISTQTITDTSLNFSLFAYWAGTYTECEIQDLKIYNYACTAQQAQAYHNSFNKLTLRETFSDAGADEIVKTPREWIKGTGDYKITEEDYDV